MIPGTGTDGAPDRETSSDHEAKTVEHELSSYRATKSYSWCNLEVVHLVSSTMEPDDSCKLPFKETQTLCLSLLWLSSHLGLHRWGSLRLADGVGKKQALFVDTLTCIWALDRNELLLHYSPNQVCP